MKMVVGISEIVMWTVDQEVALDFYSRKRRPKKGIFRLL